MPEKIHYNAEDDIIEVYAYDVVTKEEWLRDIKIINDLSAKHNCKKVLADIRNMTMAPPIHELLDVGMKELLTTFKYANFLTPDHPIASASNLLELSVGKQGIPLSNFFSREEAIDWLNSE